MIRELTSNAVRFRVVKRLALEGLTIRASLALGFGLTLGVWLFTGYYFTRRMSAVESEAAAISSRYMRAQELLSHVSAQVLLTSVYLRDALLETNANEIPNHRRRLEETYETLDRELDQYVPVLDSAAEREQVRRLRHEIDDFRVITDDVVGHGEARTAAETRAVLNAHVVPRRESVIRVSEGVRTFNRTAFINQQRVISELHRTADRRSWQWLGVALAVSLGIGVLATAYSSRLENRLRKQREIEAKNTEHLQLLSSKLITAQEQERQSIARELHDEVGQVLTAIKVELAVAQRRIAQSEGAPELLDDLLSIADAALRSVRDLSYLLHPALLDDLGLPATVDWYLSAFAKRYGIKTDLQCEGLTGRLTSDVELASYRIVQEALTNVARHAHARSCRVMLRRADDHLHICIHDDGKGFDVDIAGDTAVRRGLGLLGMRERVGQLKGALRVQSAPGQGTRIEVDLPAWAAPDVRVEEVHG